MSNNFKTHLDEPLYSFVCAFLRTEIEFYFERSILVNSFSGVGGGNFNFGLNCMRALTRYQGVELNCIRTAKPDHG